MSIKIFSLLAIFNEINLARDAIDATVCAMAKGKATFERRRKPRK